MVQGKGKIKLFKSSFLKFSFKVRDKLANACVFDQATYDKVMKEVPNYKVITPSIVSDRMKIRGSLARSAIKVSFLTHKLALASYLREFLR